MRITYLLSLLLLLSACGGKVKQNTTDTNKAVMPLVLVKNTNEKAKEPATIADDTLDIADETATYYIVVADTGTNYYTLHDKMFALHKAISNPIDTMGRYYNAKKDIIVLPENDEDEIYAGDYFPRRTPSETLSLEYLNLYKTDAGNKTMALVAGIYETKASADSAFKFIANNPSAFVQKADLYIGCMH